MAENTWPDKVKVWGHSVPELSKVNRAMQRSQKVLKQLIATLCRRGISLKRGVNESGL
jgi:DNA-binding winged helix-turn-helix (wHTH) protein